MASRKKLTFQNSGANFFSGMDSKITEISIELATADQMLVLVCLLSAAALTLFGFILFCDRARLAPAVFWLGALLAAAVPVVGLDLAMGREVAPGIAAGRMFWPPRSFEMVAEAYLRGGEPAVRSLARESGWAVTVLRKVE